MIERIGAVAGVPTPQASYSTYTRFKDLIFVSGQVAVEPETGRIPSSFADQLKLVLDHIRNILESTGSSMDQVLRMTVFLKDRAYRTEYDEIFRTYFKGGFPARSTIVADLMREEFLVEIEAIAAAPR
ncbi:MAG: RidA family protein [Desulfobacterota bacterium]|nr:RidA family protein [Thermodesulfobacteriota bacterium]